MQLTLDREINGNKLEDNVKIFTAGNPEENDDDVEYQVNSMNAALLDRLTILSMESSFNDWFNDFASKSVSVTDPATGKEKLETMIDEDIIRFLATYKEYFHVTKGSDRIKPTPRSWHKASEAKRFNDMLGYGNGTLEASLAGKVGGTISSAFITFLDEKDNPFLTVEEIFTNKPLKEVIKNRIKNETVPRLMVVSRNLIHHMAENLKDFSKQNTENYIEYMELLPKDTMFALLKLVYNDFNDIHNKLTKSEVYMDIFFNAEKLIRSAK